jgi:hypothetical protein
MHCLTFWGGGAGETIDYPAQPGLTLSCLGAPLVRNSAFTAHISMKNGPIRMIPFGKVFIDVLQIHFACSLMQIGPLGAKLNYRFDGRFC